MFWRIVKADYSDRYATYQTGGFWPSWTTSGSTWGISSSFVCNRDFIRTV